jgi:MFS family permease
MSSRVKLRINLSLNESEKKAFRLHMIYQSVEGIILGVLALNEFVFIKSINGSDYQVGFLFQFSMIVFVFLFFFNELRKRIRNKKRLLRVAGLATRLPLLIIAFFPSDPAVYTFDSIYHYIFLGIFLVYFFGNIIVYPAINVLLKTNYRHDNFGKLYGYSTSLNKIIMLVTTLIYGISLDADPFSFRYAFFIVAISGVVSIFFLSGIDYSRVRQTPKAPTWWASVVESARTMGRILKTNKPYLEFEVSFMFYGLAFMLTAPVINIYFEDALHLNYSSVAFYKNAYNILAIILLLFTGKLLGKMDPRNFSALTFLSLLLYVFFMMLAQYFPVYIELGKVRIYPALVLSFISYGYFAATMVLLWNIGSAYFCSPEEADDYQSVHLFLTGIRAIFAPILGVYFFKLLGFTGNFLVAIAALAIAMAFSLYSRRKEKIRSG